MYLLNNQVMNYAWGSHSSLAALRGEEPAPQPEAELWMGAHPKAPSSLEVGQQQCSLNELIEEEPERWLGIDHRSLPFLFKVLAAETALSIQAHPSKAQAEAGFAKENAAGLAPDAPNRNYRDDNHKPELLCALTRFEALCGFRPVPESLELLGLLDLEGLKSSVDALWQAPGGSGLRCLIEQVLAAGAEQQRQWVGQTVWAAASGRLPHEYEGSAHWVVELGRQYPGDVGVLMSLLMNHLVLEPGEAIYMPAGNLHAYLKGTGVELMANSDNVLRGGLTPKHMDVPELLSVLDFDAEPPQKAALHQTAWGTVYQSDATEFELSRVLLSGVVSLPPVRGPEIVLCTEGVATLSLGAARLTLSSAQSAYLPPREHDLQLEGEGTLYRAALPQQRHASSEDRS